MNSVEQALKAPASELIRAASRPATTIPRMPTGSTCWTISGKAAWALAVIDLAVGAEKRLAEGRQLAALRQGQRRASPG